MTRAQQSNRASLWSMVAFVGFWLTLAAGLHFFIDLNDVGPAMVAAALVAIAVAILIGGIIPAAIWIYQASKFDKEKH